MSKESRWKRNAVLATAAALWASGVPAVFAQGGDFATASPHKIYAFVGFATLAPEKNRQLWGEHGTIGNWIAGGGYRISPNLAAEVNYLISLRTPDTPKTAEPPAGTFSPGSLDSYMLTYGIGATVKYRFSAERLVPYAGGGVGVYQTRWETKSDAASCTSLIGCFGNGPSVRAHSTNLGFHALAGADYHITARDVVAAELRYLKLDADLGDIVHGKVHVGGIFFWMGYRHVFP
jgi:opacity protein-like surface antigen